MHPRYLIAGLLALTLTACGSKAPLVYPPSADGQARPAPNTGANPNMQSPSPSQIQPQ